MLVRNARVDIVLTPRYSCICLLLREGLLLCVSLLSLVWGNLRCIVGSRDQLFIPACKAAVRGDPLGGGLEGRGFHCPDIGSDRDDH